MLNQIVSIDDTDYPDAGATALSPLPRRDDIWAVDCDLKARLIRAAAASAFLSPDVIPGAAVLLQPVALPLTSDRKRRAAAPFAMEPFLAAPLEETFVSVGPLIGEAKRLCAAIDRDELKHHMQAAKGTGALLPDLCAVPLPDTENAWSIWFGQHATYLRTFDGAGCVIATDSFYDLWRGFDRPPLKVCHGVVPPGVNRFDRMSEMTPVTASVFELDMRPVQRASRDLWRNRLGFALGLSAVAGLAHTAVLFTDARALERTATERRTALVAAAQDRGVVLDFNLPSSVLTAELARRANPGDRTDPFLGLLARTGTGLKGLNGIDFRDLRYDASTGNVTVLVSAPDLAALQQAEDALRTIGMSVTGGATATSATGAEMQLILRETG